MPDSAVLYLAPVRRTFHELHASLSDVSWIDAMIEGARHHWVGFGLDIRFELVTEADAAAARVRERHYPLVIVDCRQPDDGTDAEAEAQERTLHDFLEQVRDERDFQRRYPFDRIVVLVGGRDVARTDRLLFDAGRHHVGLVLRDRGLAPGATEPERRHGRNQLLHDIWDLAQTLLSGRKVRRSALCAAGGGITGIYYELGVLKCLEDAFVDFDLGDFDMYFGISAGAIITSLLVNDLSIDELIERFGGYRGNELDVELRLRDLNVREIPLHVRSTLYHVRDYLRRARRRKERFTITNLGWQLAALIGPLFDTTRLERSFADFLSRPGRTNRFERLGRELYIGTTDQDSREHVLFGSEGHRHINISKVVQASAAIHPFFRSVEIGGRHYTDGFVTRTSNLSAALERGANLVFVIDPFVPQVSPAGHQMRHGLFWGVLQDYKTVAYTRFERVTDALLRSNPHVACLSFVPSRRMRRVMSTNPMARSYFDTIVIEAYRSTFRRLRGLEHKVGPRLLEYGIHMDLGPVAATVNRIDGLLRPDARALLEASRKAAREVLPPGVARLQPRPAVVAETARPGARSRLLARLGLG